MRVSVDDSRLCRKQRHVLKQSIGVPFVASFTRCVPSPDPCVMTAGSPSGSPCWLSTHTTREHSPLGRLGSILGHGPLEPDVGGRLGERHHEDPQDPAMLLPDLRRRCRQRWHSRHTSEIKEKEINRGKKEDKIKEEKRKITGRLMN